MSKTSIQVAPLPPLDGASSPPVQRQPDWLRVVKKGGRILASLRLTVLLFVLSMFLVFTGTLAMRDSGLWATLYGYFRCWIAWVPLQTFVPFGQVFFGMPLNLRVPGGFYYPGGWLIGTALLVNLLAAHSVRFQIFKRADRSILLQYAEATDSAAMTIMLRVMHFILFRIEWKRSGILMIHSGLIILMLGEFITGKFASEALMPIVIGESSNYLQQPDRVELAFIQDDPKDPGKDRVIVVPDQMLRNGGTIDDAHLPFTIEVVRFAANTTTRLRPHHPDEERLATRGDGVEVTIDERPPGAGADSSQKTDMPAAYVTLSDKRSGASLGTYLLWVYLNEQEIVGGDGWRMALRYRRSYQPYRIYLEEFHHDVYPGTDIPKNFSSRVRLVPDEGASREVVIYMNNPLRYEKQTFYQSGTLDADTGTVLQVVKNPGAEMPYLACALVCLGMLIHFGLHLSSFLALVDVSGTEERDMNGNGRRLPWLAVGAATLYLIFKMIPLGESPTVMHLQELSGLPVQDNGRIKPFDSMARTTLILISGKQDYIDENGRTQAAVKWVLDVLTHNPSADRSKVFRIENDQVLSLLGLQPRSETHFRYALDEFRDKTRLKQLWDKAEAAKLVPDRERDVFQVKVIELQSHLYLYLKLDHQVAPRLLPPLSSGEQDWRSVGEVMAALPDPNANFLKIAEQDRDLAMVLAILKSYDSNDPKVFNKMVAEYRNDMDQRYAVETGRTDTELFFNHFEPFYQCSLLYGLVFLLSCLAWFGWSDALNRAAFWMTLVALVVHTFALITRMYLMDRWFVFVTNLYSSAVFIGWGCVLVCLVMERLFKNGIATLVGSVLGGLTMIVAHHLAAGDTLEMMRAVLDTNFWLATHVTCINFGYTATFVAGFLGLVYIIRGVLTPSLDSRTARTLARMIYGVVCFAMLLSFTGTVLGGIWADQSWGRFWGWDPKENGALMIVIWNALILHARWGGVVKQRGMAVLAIAGNMVTAWSYFGTNQLGVGLHAYGFNDTLAAGLVVFWASQIAAIALGLLPLHRWASYGR